MAVRISLLLAAEATRDLPASAVTVQTPLGPAEGRRVSADVVVVPVLRAGLGMLDAVLELPWSQRADEIQRREPRVEDEGNLLAHAPATEQLVGDPVTQVSDAQVLRLLRRARAWLTTVVTPYLA